MSESTATYGLVDVLAARGISRRSFLKFCGTLAVAAGLSSAAAPRVANALETELENAKGGLVDVAFKNAEKFNFGIGSRPILRRRPSSARKRSAVHEPFTASSGWLFS